MVIGHIDTFPWSCVLVVDTECFFTMHAFVPSDKSGAGVAVWSSQAILVDMCSSSTDRSATTISLGTSRGGCAPCGFCESVAFDLLGQIRPSITRSTLLCRPGC